jgi:hypothetical protein
MAAIRPNPTRPTVGGVVGGILGIRDEIQNPTPGNPVGPIGQAVCNTLSSVGYDDIPLNNRTGPGFVCEPYWNDKGFDPPQEMPPFTGGQCAGVSYTVTMQWDVYSDGADCSNPGTQAANRNATGPIKGVSLSSFNGNDGPCPQGEGDVVTLNATNVDGSPRDIIVQGAGSDIFANPRITNIVRIDGQPDNCGDPPPDSVPGPSNPGTPYDQPQPLPGYPGVDIIVGAPEITEGDDYYIPITITNDDGDPVGPPIFWTPDGTPPELPPPPPPPIEPGEPQEPSDPAGDIPDDIPPEDEDEGLETIGYEWTLTGLPGNLSRIPGTSPAVLTTPYGNVQLRYEDGTGATRYSDNLPIRVVSGSILRQDTRLTVKGVVYSRRPDIGGIRLTPLRVRRM